MSRVSVIRWCADSDPIPTATRLARIVVVAVVYAVTGRLALMLAVPPGFSTAIWPPAGIALAMMLIWGRGIWPGILVGSFLGNLWVSQEAVLAGDLRTWIACSLIALGASAQTLASSWLLERFSRLPIELTRIADIGRFFFFGGAVGCTVNSLFGPTALLACGIISPSQFSFNAWNWWIGDTIGVLLAAPLILIWSGYNGTLWHEYRRGITATVLLASLGVIGMFFFGSKLEMDRIEAEFEKSAGAITASIQGELDTTVRALESLQGLFDSSDSVDANQFRTFTSRMLEEHPSISALSWNPIVRHDERDRFERTRLGGHGGLQSIYELDEQGHPVAAVPRDTYVVVEYIEPSSRHGVVVGFDTSSKPARRISLEQARDTAAPVATPALQLVQSERRRPGMLILGPVFEGGRVPTTVEERRMRIEGYVVSVVFIDSLLASVLEELAVDLLTVSVWDTRDHTRPIPIVSTFDHRPGAEMPLSAERSVEFAGRTWNLSIAAGHDYLTAHRAPGVWLLLAAGLLLCAMLSGFLLVLAGHAHREAQRAAHDTLTGLVNRGEFEKRLVRSIERSRADGASHCLCFLDLDQFKVVNDTAGHAAGDGLLREVARLIRSHVRTRDTLARLGGDEFGLLLEHCGVDDARKISERIVHDIREYRFDWDGQTFGIGVSIGLASIDDSTRDSAQAMQQADMACYTAKELGRSRVHVFCTSDRHSRRRASELRSAADLRSVLDENRLLLYAQRIDDLRPQRRKQPHFELLLRIRDTDGALMPPAPFIRAAEQYDLMAEVDRWVVHHALANSPHLAGGDATLSINLSGKSLADDNLAEFIIQAILDHGIRGSRVCFEITETEAIQNLDAALVFIGHMKALGCRFALDDFGSGMSSFKYLKDLPIDYLKIDGSLVRDVATEESARSMVAAIHAVARTMSLETIAEHVSDLAILEVLQQIGIDHAQGFFLHEPEAIHATTGVSTETTLV